MAGDVPAYDKVRFCSGQRNIPSQKMKKSDNSKQKFDNSTVTKSFNKEGPITGHIST